MGRKKFELSTRVNEPAAQGLGRPGSRFMIIYPNQNRGNIDEKDGRSKERRDLFTVHNCLTVAQSNAFIKAAEAVGFVHQGSLGPTKGEAYRDNDRMAINDRVLADTLWESGISKLFSDPAIRGKVAVGLNPNIRLYSRVAAPSLSLSVLP
ncbi:hypothetical protein SSX86_019757 [Deinandra increscens subsp. villosa]|uniref:Uncharacterized protein n=1 Tax=Deinandra increscens subsp. villosa TaxID=3103831 RepID=A0AAP0CXZ6_9ASTR